MHSAKLYKQKNTYIDSDRIRQMEKNSNRLDYSSS